jgi:tetraacyldisaccharide 4'-kinase
MKRPLLLPLVPIYAAGVALRELRLRRGWERVRRLCYPVISIGNLSTGGAGKTPLTIALARLLTANGFHVDVLSRGYGRSGKEAVRVDPNGNAEQYGDEPLLIAREAAVPVYVAAERYEAGELAEVDSVAIDEVRVHILDDGFQHRQLHRDVDVLLVNREDWQDRLLPGGNLREGLHAAMRASVIAIPASDVAFESELRDRGWSGTIWRVRRRMEVPQISGPVAAFCGIARPEQFFEGLKAAGLRLVMKKAFADHHRYTSQDVDALNKAIRSSAATAILTTEKDRVRISSVGTSLPLQTVPLRSEIEDETAVLEWLAARLSSRSADASL